MISARKHLLRAEYNVGMSLVEQGKFVDAVPHLLGVGEGFRGLARSARVKNPYPEGNDAERNNIGGEGGDKGSVALECADEIDPVPLFLWVEALERDGVSDVGGLYASSLNLLGECLVSIPSRSLAVAMGVLKASVEAFIAVGDPVGATEPLEKLVDLAHRKPRGEEIGRRFCSTAEALGRATSEALRKARKDGSSEGVGGSVVAVDGVDDALAQVNDLQTRLDEFRENDVATREGSYAGNIGKGSSSVRQHQQRENRLAGHNSGANPSASPDVSQRRVVGLTSISSLRRYQRQFKAFSTSPAKAIGVLRGRKNVATHCRKVSKASRDGVTVMRNAVVETHAGAAQLGGRSSASGRYNGSFSGPSLGAVSGNRWQGQRGSFAELRKAAAAVMTEAECPRMMGVGVLNGSSVVDGEGKMEGSPAAAYVNMVRGLGQWITFDQRSNKYILKLKDRRSAALKDVMIHDFLFFRGRESMEKFLAHTP